MGEHLLFPAERTFHLSLFTFSPWSGGKSRALPIASWILNSGSSLLLRRSLRYCLVANQGVFPVAGSVLCVESPPMFMKRTPILIAVLALSSGVYAEDAKPSPSPAASQASPSTAFKDEKDKLSYTIGVDIGKTLQRIPGELNQTALTQGITDVLGNKPKALSDAELQQVMQAFQQKLSQQREEAMAQKQQDMKSSAETNKVAGKKFLDSNSKQPGITTLADGLQYKVVKNGSGEKPKDTDVVEVNYRGTLIDGKEFDSSAKNGGPVSFPVNEVIKGWSEALKLMPVGSKWQLYLPAELAYGDEGEGDDIAPGSTLVFEVELLGIKKDAKENNPAQQAATPKAQ